jgi:single-stranded DNA-specific DHH superfamily exonuclease
MSNSFETKCRELVALRNAARAAAQERLEESHRIDVLLFDLSSQYTAELVEEMEELRERLTKAQEAVSMAAIAGAEAEKEEVLRYLNDLSAALYEDGMHERVEQVGQIIDAIAENAHRGVMEE